MKQDVTNCNSDASLSKPHGETIDSDEQPKRKEPDLKPNGKSQMSPEAAGVNLLIDETSPYLLSHADNPVDWLPWGAAAFNRAKRLDRPIFLSIGYSTCHWCHVMARESFEDKSVAEILNRSFVSVKVDREEHPEVDHIYMMACQMMTGGGGWPLTIVTTPAGEPFFAATYLPREGRGGTMGLVDLLLLIERMWAESRNDLLETSKEVALRLRQGAAADGMPPSGIKGLKAAATVERKDLLSAISNAFSLLQSRFDVINGGFASAPKFPTPHILLFLLRYWKRAQDPLALDMVETSLSAMASGGIFDHLGGGFHRYSTDAEWRIPHFEKMLYDQAMLLLAYLEAYQATGKKEYASTAREVFSYLIRDMRTDDCGFSSAEDADSDGVEGKFYVWTADEIVSVLGREEASLFLKLYSLEPSEGVRGAGVIRMTASTKDLASSLGLDENEVVSRIEESRRKLLLARDRRNRPAKDDKILADWNGLIIASLARGGTVLENASLTKAARDAASFVLERMHPKSGLLHSYRAGKAAIPANIDDYAFMIYGLIELYQADFDALHLEHAVSLAGEMIERLIDRAEGGFFFAGADRSDLIARRKEIYDGAIPSGNSIAMLDLLILSRITGNVEFEKAAWSIWTAFSEIVKSVPAAYPQLLCALDFGLGSMEIGIAGSSDTMAQKMAQEVRRKFIPNKVLMMVDDASLQKIAPMASSMRSVDGKATAYVCVDKSCSAPTGDLVRLRELISQEPGRG